MQPLPLSPSNHKYISPGTLAPSLTSEREEGSRTERERERERYAAGLTDDERLTVKRSKKQRQKWIFGNKDGWWREVE